MDQYLTSTRKVVLSGSIAEFYKYDHPVLLERQFLKRVDRKKEKCLKNPVDLERRSLARARQKLRRLINANSFSYGLAPKTLVLTFPGGFKDLKSGNVSFSKFIDRLNDFCFGRKNRKLKYVGVPEFRKSGDLHYHLCFFNLPYTYWKKVEELWRRGYIWIERKDYRKGIATYMVKEMVKGFSARYGLNQKSYFASRHLKPPKLQNLEEVVNDLERLPLPKKLVFKEVFWSQYVGFVKYRQYDLGKSRKEFHSEFEKYSYKFA